MDFSPSFPILLSMTHQAIACILGIIHWNVNRSWRLISRTGHHLHLLSKTQFGTHTLGFREGETPETHAGTGVSDGIWTRNDRIHNSVCKVSKQALIKPVHSAVDQKTLSDRYRQTSIQGAALCRFIPGNFLPAQISTHKSRERSAQKDDHP